MTSRETAVWLGALQGDPKDFIVYFFVPSRTRDGEPINHVHWRDEALDVMATLFGGATAIQANGAWRDDERDGEVGLEEVAIVASLMAESDWNETSITNLAQFLHRMGK